MMSEKQYQRLRGAAWDQLQATIDQMRSEASAAGLTDADQEAQLRDD